MSLITGREWEAAVGRYLARANRDDLTCERSSAPAEFAGGRSRFTSPGPADFQLRGRDWRAGVEVKAWTNGAIRWPLLKIKPSQAADLDAADHGLILLRWAGDHATAPDMVYLLDWLDIGPLWWAAHEGIAHHGHGSLTEPECHAIARSGYGADGTRIRMDDHGDWSCPPFLFSVISAWGRLPG